MKSVFLFEDDPDDILLFEDALREVDRTAKLTATRDSEVGLHMLHDPAQPLPDVLVLDINMPVLNGLDCLVELRKQERTRKLPVIMLSTNQHHAVMKEAYEKGVNHYIPKPSRFEDLKAAISVIIHTPWHDNWPTLP